MKRLLAIAIVSAFAIATVSAQQPADLFKSKCAMCHGPDAAGKTAMGARLNIPDLRTVQKQPAATLAQAITKGKNKMPSFEGKLTGEQISQLVAYVQQLK